MSLVNRYVKFITKKIIKDCGKESPMITSGFGIGLERFMLFLTDLKDIRNVQLIPRDLKKEILP